MEDDKANGLLKSLIAQIIPLNLSTLKSRTSKKKEVLRLEKVFIACSILKNELTQVMQEMGLQNKIVFIDAALHVNIDRLEEALREKLDETSHIGKPLILVGDRCHPDMDIIAKEYDGQIVPRANCLELLLGDKMKELNKEANIFYTTSAWLTRWKEIFITGLGWDEIDGRQNFGFYDKILLLDWGIPVDDMDLLEFFEFTQVPIEPYPISLDNLKKEMTKLLSVDSDSSTQNRDLLETAAK